VDFGIVVATASNSWQMAERAEAAGLHTMWFYDSQLLVADPFAAMAAAAMKTNRLRLGTGVLVPSNRLTPVAANGFATLNGMAPGRIDAGVGTGFTARRAMGQGPMKLADMAASIRSMQAMWRGETVEIPVDGKPRKVRFVNQDLRLINLDDPIPVHVSAMGPRSRRVTAELGAHWINIDFDESIAAAAARDMDEAYRAAGRDPAKQRKTLFVFGSVLKEGEPYDSPRVKAECGPFAVLALHDAMEANDHGSLVGGDAPDPSADTRFAHLVREYAPVYRSYQPADERHLTLHRGHLFFLRPEEERFATAELIQATTFTGTAAQLRDRLRRTAEAGYDEVTVQITPGRDSMFDDWMRVFEMV
jgi:5,10-methylenetetrahydromethanopterin reductase